MDKPYKITFNPKTMNTITILAGPDQGWEGVDPEKLAIHFEYEDKIWMLVFTRDEFHASMLGKVRDYDLMSLTDAQCIKFYPQLFDKFLHSKRMEWVRINEDGEPMTAHQEFLNDTK